MSKIYLDQSNLKMTAETEVTLTGATTTQIKYIKPDGTSGAWDADIASNQTDLEYEFSDPSELDQASVWTFWAYVVFADGRNAPGEPEKVQVFNQGT